MLLRMLNKENIPPLLVGGETCKATVEINMTVRKLGPDLPEVPGILLLGLYPSDSPSHHKDTCSVIFIVVLLIIVGNWN